MEPGKQSLYSPAPPTDPDLTPPMLFRNLVIYRLPADYDLSPIDLEEKLMGRRLAPCGPFEMQSRGFVKVGGQQRLVHSLERQSLLALGVEQKLLPASVIRQFVRDRAEELATEQGFPVGRRQMRDLTLKVTEELRPRALARRRETAAWIDPVHGWFIVDAAGQNRAEELVETLRDTLGSFAVLPLDTERSPQAAMGAWLARAEAPGRFRIDEDLELKAVDKSRATIRYSRHPFDNQQVKRHLEERLGVTQLGLTWNDRISFVLTEKLQVKRVQFLGLEKAEPAADPKDAAERLDGEFALMAGELAALLEELAEILGAAPIAAEPQASAVAA